MNIFSKKMRLIVDVFPKLRTSKDVVRSMSIKSRFRGLFEKQHGKRAQILLKSEQQHLCHIYWSMVMQLKCKKSHMLVICKSWRLFVDTFTVDDKYFLLTKENLTQSIQMQLSQKQKTLSQFFSQFLKSNYNFENFQKKDDPHNWYISEITDSEKRG